MDLTALSLPSPGTFIRPVGPTGFRYCLKVDRVIANRVLCARWGMRNRLPFDDGHVSRPDFCVELRAVRPGVWKVDAKPWEDRFLNPVYWVSTGDRNAQLDLFGSAV